MGLELLHLSYVQRWVVAPTRRPQSVAEHTFRVMAIAEHLATVLKLTRAVRATLRHKAMYHDDDERLTGDIPGPVKSQEDGYLKAVTTMYDEDRILKVADSIETGTFWVQWGHPSAWTGHPYNQAPARDVDKIFHYSQDWPELRMAAIQTWESITGKDFPWPNPLTKP